MGQIKKSSKTLDYEEFCKDIDEESSRVNGEFSSASIEEIKETKRFFLYAVKVYQKSIKKMDIELAKREKLKNQDDK